MLSIQQQNYVCERKFAGSAMALGRVTAILESSCIPDPEFPVGAVNSIYFDTPAFASYREKADGDNIKTKVRLRWYGLDEELAPLVVAFFEIKRRIGSARDKTRAKVTVPRALVAGTSLASPELKSLLLAQLARLAIPSPLSWQPVCRIAYSRRRYLDEPSGSRVSIDWDIRADRFNCGILPLGGAVALDDMVCEFKNSSGTPPRWAGAMLESGLRYGSFSKYGAAMARLLQGD